MLATRAFEYWTFTAIRTWRLTFFVNVVTPVMFLAAMGLGLGHLVDSHGSGSLGGSSYLDFLAPALVAATVFQTAVNEATYPVMASIRWMRTYDAMLATPLRVVDVMRGHLSFIVARSALVGLLFLAATALFGVIQSPWVVLCIPAVVLLAAGCALPVAAFSATITEEVWFAVLLRLVVVPLFLFSGTFAPLSALPDAVALVARVTPLWHAVSLCRDGSSGHVQLGSTLMHLAYLSTLTGLGYAWCTRAFKRRLLA